MRKILFALMFEMLLNYINSLGLKIAIYEGFICLI